MVKCYRKAVSLSDLWVSDHERLSDFYASAWQKGDSPVPLLAVRVVLAAVAAAILVWSVVESPTPYWLIFLTNWGMLMVTLMTLSGTAVSVMAMRRTYYDSSEIPWYASMYWLFFNIATPTAFLITALYWILLYNPDAEETEDSRRLFWLDVANHGFNSIIAITELVVSRTPVRALHVYQPLGIGLWYAGFSAVYYAAGGVNGAGEPFIYEILDWRQGRRSGIIVVASVAGLLIIYTVVWGLAFCRDKISTAVVRTTSHDLPLTPPDQHMPRQIV